MEKLERNFKEYLPLNRKERFYTGTVLPGIICFENFKHINLFFKLIKGFPQNLVIQPDSVHNNIQFLTEYSLLESANFIGKAYCDLPATKDTPDLIILITEPELYLVVIEGKMFSSCKIDEFKRQIEAQEKIIHCIETNLQIRRENIFHLGLVPRSFFSFNIQTSCQMLYWEDIIDTYQDILSKNYFFETLKLALNNFTKLKTAHNGSFGSFEQNNEDKLTGREILTHHKLGKKFWVGRGGGRIGKTFHKDLETGGWESFRYEVNYSSKVPPNINWFSSKEFVEAVSNGNNHAVIIADDKNPWHFSFLGRYFFEKVSAILGYNGSLDCPIQAIYTGKTGEEYQKKLLGRKVNPNWFVIMNNGKQLKSDNVGKLVEGSYSATGYLRTKWDLIKNYNW